MPPAARRVGAVLGCCIALAPALLRARPRELRIGTVSGQIDQLPPESFRPFTDYLSSHVDGPTFQMVPLASIEAMLRDVDAERLHCALVTPAALVELGSRHEVRPIATVTQMAGGTAYPARVAQAPAAPRTVLVVEDHDDVRAFATGVLQGSIAFLAKPYSPEGLLAKVASVLDTPDSAAPPDGSRS